MSMGCLFTTIPQQRDNKQSEVWVRGEFDCSSFISAFIQELNYENTEARSKGKFLLFNTEECKHLSITNYRNILETSYSLGTELIPLSKEEKRFDSVNKLSCPVKLSWHGQSHKVLQLIKRTSGTCNQPRVLLKLYIYLVRPHVEFACQVWYSRQVFDLIQLKEFNVMLQHWS